MIDDTVSLDGEGDLIKIINLILPEKKIEEYPEDKYKEGYFPQKSNYEFKSPDYLFLMSKIQKINDKRA